MLLLNESLTVSSYLVQFVAVAFGKHVLDLLLQITLRNRYVMAIGYKAELLERFPDYFVGQQ